MTFFTFSTLWSLEEKFISYSFQKSVFASMTLSPAKNNKAGMGSSKSCTDFIDCYDLIFLYANGRIAIPAAGDYFPLFTTTTHRLVMFPLFTVMRTLPAFFALITPFLETVAIFLFDDLNEMLSVLPALTFTFKR